MYTYVKKNKCFLDTLKILLSNLLGCTIGDRLKTEILSNH